MADGVLKIPIQSSDMKSLAIRCGCVPDSCHCACSFNEFWEDIESADLSGESFFSNPFPNSFDLFVKSRACVSFGDLDIEVKQSVEKW